MSKTPSLIFFIGTTAELIKVFTVIKEAKNKAISCKIVASGQNNIAETDIIKELGLKVDLQLSSETEIKKSAVGLFSWWSKTLPKAVKKIKNTFTDVDFDNSIMVIHGDTISTLMGALTAKMLGMKSAHIEAGLRSEHIFTPFPEEIDRRLTSCIADYHFCPGYRPYDNLSDAKKKINTYYNTIIDALDYSKTIPCEDERVNALTNKDYCVFVCHRQENLMQPKLVREVVRCAINTASKRTVVFIMHQITKNTLISMDLYSSLENNPNIILLDRVNYFDFMKLLINSKFVITDGGSNQEELAYMGKPTLIVRKYTERTEGLGRNVLMYNGDMSVVERFIDEYEKYSYEETVPDVSPSTTIADRLEIFLKLL